jgi:hypothetical protein
MDFSEVYQRLALLATNGTPEQRQAAALHLEQLRAPTATRTSMSAISDLSTEDAAAVEESAAKGYGGVCDVSAEELRRAGIPFVAGVVILEMDITRVDQDEHDTIQLVEKHQRPKTDSARMLHLRNNILPRCVENHPSDEGFYHKFLTLAYIRRNTKVLRRKRGEAHITDDPVPVLSSDHKSSACYDDYDLVDEFDHYHGSIDTLYHQLYKFNKMLRTLEARSETLSVDEQEWLISQDAEMQAIFHFLRTELLAINVAEYRAVFEQFRSGHVDYAALRNIWRCEQPQVLSILRARTLMKLVSEDAPSFSMLTRLFYKELASISNAAKDLTEYYRRVDASACLSATSSAQPPTDTIGGAMSLKDMFRQYGARMFPSHGLARTRVVDDLLIQQQFNVPADLAELQQVLLIALQSLWCECMKEYTNGNHSRALEHVISQCVVDRDAVLTLVRRACISYTTDTLRAQWYSASAIATKYGETNTTVDDLEDVRPNEGKRHIAFLLWSVLRNSDHYYVDPTEDDENPNTEKQEIKLFANEEDACKRAFLILRCVARHNLTRDCLMDAFLNCPTSGYCNETDKAGIERGQKYLKCIKILERWLQTKQKSKTLQPSENPPLEDVIAGVVPARENIRPRHWIQRREKLMQMENNEIALVVHDMTKERREATRLQWLSFAAFILPSNALVKPLSISRYEHYRRLYNIFCKEQMENFAQARGSG